MIWQSLIPFNIKLWNLWLYKLTMDGIWRLNGRPVFYHETRIPSLKLCIPKSSVHITGIAHSSTCPRLTFHYRVPQNSSQQINCLTCLSIQRFWLSRIDTCQIIMANYSGNKHLNKDFSQGSALGPRYWSIIDLFVISIVYCVIIPTIYIIL